MRYVREAVMAAIRAIVALAGWATVMAFNLEPRIAIVKEGPKGVLLRIQCGAAPGRLEDACS